MKLKLRAICAILGALPIFQSAMAADPLAPSLLQLLADPAKYHGRKVQVSGFCRLEYERLAIYLHKEDHAHHLGNAVWLNFQEAKDFTPKRRRIAYCLVEGVFSAANRGHMGVYPGAIEQISRYEPWPPKLKHRVS
jgi:hypothetical protein